MSATHPNRLPGAVFADRDGTLIEEVGYLSSLDYLRLLPGVGEAAARLRSAGIPLVVITNQSGVARGLFEEAFVTQAADRLAALLAAAGGELAGHFYCPHHPDGRPPYNRACDCRKPRAGLIEEAVRSLGIDPKGAWMVGDKRSDLETGTGLGLVPVLVRTGYGQDTEGDLPSDFAARGGRVFADFPAAVDALLAGSGTGDG